MDNKVILMKKDSKPLDNFTMNFFKHLAESRRKQRKKEFKDWLNREDDNGHKTGKFLSDFYRELKGILVFYDLDIINEKEFKDEIATFIYNLSE